MQIWSFKFCGFIFLKTFSKTFRFKGLMTMKNTSNAVWRTTLWIYIFWLLSSACFWSDGDFFAHNQVGHSTSWLLPPYAFCILILTYFLIRMDSFWPNYYVGCWKIRITSFFFFLPFFTFYIFNPFFAHKVLSP